MRELWLKIKPWFVGVACGWVLLAFIFLCASVDHSLFSAETATKIYKAFNDIILLKWVTKYQTLLAGLAAIIGGSFVLFSTRLSAYEATKKENQRRREEAIAACTLVSIDFRQAAYQMLYYPRLDAVKYFTNTSSFLPKLASIDPMLADIVASCKNNTMLFLLMDRHNSSLLTLHTAALECYMIWQILLHVADNIKLDGRFDLRNTNNIPPKDMWPFISQLLVRPDISSGYYGFFDWQYSSTHSPTSPEPEPK